MSRSMQLEIRHLVNVCSQVSSSTNMPQLLSKMHAEYKGVGKYF
jgi:hypothetical protein